MFIPSHNHMITQVFIAAVPAIPTLPRCQLHWRTQLMFRMQGIEAIHFIPAVSQDVIQVMHHQDIVVVTFLRRSRKVAPEGLPWVLLYEVKGRAASPVTWFIRRLLVILGPPPPKSLRRTLRADSKHCNLQYFCSFRIKKPHFATWWNLRKYQCFC